MPPDNPLDRRNGLSPDLGDLARQQPAQGSSEKPPPLVMAPGGGVQYQELPPRPPSPGQSPGQAGGGGAPPTIAGALEHQQRWGSPPVAQQIPDILGKTTSIMASPVTGPWNAFKDLTGTALQSAPGQIHPEGMGAKAGRAAWMLPTPGLAWEASVARIINEARLNPERFAGTDIGMFKLVPNKSYYDKHKGAAPPGRGTYYDLIDHNDQKIAELDDVRIGKGGHINVGYYRGPIALGIRQQTLARNHPAVRLNEGAHGMTTQEQLGMGAALAREFPQQPAGPNFAGGFRVSGVHSINNPDQRLPMTEGRRQRAFREAESLPKMPEFEKELFETGLANIRENPTPQPAVDPYLSRFRNRVRETITSESPQPRTPWAVVEPIMDTPPSQAETRRRAMEAPDWLTRFRAREREREALQRNRPADNPTGPAQPFPTPEDLNRILGPEGVNRILGRTVGPEELNRIMGSTVRPSQQPAARPAGDPVQTTIDDLNRLFEDLSRSLNRR